MQALNKPSLFQKVLSGLFILSFTLIYSCNDTSSTEDKKDTMSDSPSTMSTSDTTMKMSTDSLKMKMGSDTTHDSTKGGQPIPGQPSGTGHKTN